MIHHVSIPAREPERVAKVLAELMGGKHFPFAPCDGGYLANSGDEYGTMVEVYPELVTLRMPDANAPITYGPNQACGYGKLEEPASSYAFHALLSTHLTVEQVEQIGAREGWRAVMIHRGRKGHKPAFKVVEFWIENRLMIEVTNKDLLSDYVTFINGEAEHIYSDPVQRKLSHATHVQEHA